MRLHRFRDLDDKCAPDTASGKLPSFHAMSDFSLKDEKVKAVFAEERKVQASEEFTDEDWQKALELDKAGKVKNTLQNLTVILMNDPLLKPLVFNQLLDGMEIKGDVPWRHPSKFWRDADDAQLISYVDSHYGTFSARNYDIAVAKVTDDRSYHPIREFIENLPEWDKVPRVDTLLIDYLGADDNGYVRAVTRKTLCAAIKRVLYPGCKFDSMLVLNGPQGVGKSTLIAKLAGEWFSDSLNLGDTKDKTAAEKLQGYWILEIGELAGLKKPRWRRCVPFSPGKTIFTVRHSARELHRTCASACSSAQPTPSPAICGTPPETAASGRSRRRVRASSTPGI